MCHCGDSMKVQQQKPQPPSSPCLYDVGLGCQGTVPLANQLDGQESMRPKGEEGREAVQPRKVLHIVDTTRGSLRCCGVPAKILGNQKPTRRLQSESGGMGKTIVPLHSANAAGTPHYQTESYCTQRRMLIATSE